MPTISSSFDFTAQDAIQVCQRCCRLCSSLLGISVTERQQREPQSWDQDRLWDSSNGKCIKACRDSAQEAYSSCSSAIVSLESARRALVTTSSPTSDMCDTAASDCCIVNVLPSKRLKFLMVPVANASKRKLRLDQSSTTCRNAWL